MSKIYDDLAYNQMIDHLPLDTMDQRTIKGLIIDLNERVFYKSNQLSDDAVKAIIQFLTCAAQFAGSNLSLRILMKVMLNIYIPLL